MITNALRAALVAGGMLVPGIAAAATAAVVTTDLNVRTGPGSGYQRFGTIPAGGRVIVHGCLTGYNWCDIDWAGNRGWVSGNYLSYRQTGRYYNRPVTSVGVSIGIPVIGFDPYLYHDRYYRGRSWYHDRYLSPREVRQDRREDRREVRQERRDDRQDVRQERSDVRDARRDLRQERRAGENTVQERRNVRQERRELIEERRELRR